MEVKKIEYIDELHLYLVNGVITPSVTQLLQKKFPNKYTGIPARILEEKCKFGNSVHEFIEMVSRGETPSLDNYPIHERLCCEQFLKLQKNHSIHSLRNEMLIHYKDKYCGRLDLIALIDDMYCLCDVKTTAKLDEEYLKYQLGLYYYALKEMGFVDIVDFDKFIAIWLPKKELGKLIEISKLTQEEFDEFMKEFVYESDSE